MKRVILGLFLGAALVGLTSYETGSPSSAAVAARPCLDSIVAVVHKGTVSWRAHGCFFESVGDTVEIDRRSGGRWIVQATIELPRGGPWEYLHGVSLTRSGVPDFAASEGGGADWTPLMVIARLQGRWQLVPFDSPDLLGTHLIVDAEVPAGGRLVHSWVDACGCASGPQTSIWYGFDGRRFVPMPPPGAAPGCTASALAGAHVLLGDPSYLGPSQWRFSRFRAKTFACRDGWALAINASGRFALFNQQAGQWHRASVGQFAFIARTARFFALPGDLLALLKRRLRP